MACGSTQCDTDSEYFLLCNVFYEICDMNNLKKEKVSDCVYTILCTRPAGAFKSAAGRLH